MPSPDRIAVIANQGSLDAQALLREAVTVWRASGLHVVGVLAENNAAEGECSAGSLRDIVSGETFSIQLDAQPVDTTCHLDAAGVEAACAHLLPQVARADVVVLSKFGKLEASQSGLWAVFRAAIATGKPLLTTVSTNFRDAWSEVAPRAAWLTGDLEAVNQWWGDRTAHAVR